MHFFLPLFLLTYRHYKETQHTYSLELGTQRVWDYTGGSDGSPMFYINSELH